MEMLKNVIPAEKTGLHVDVSWEERGEIVVINTDNSSRKIITGYRDSADIEALVIEKMTRPENFQPTHGFDYGIINAIAEYAISQDMTDPAEEPEWWISHLIDNEMDTLYEILYDHDCCPHYLGECFQNDVWVRALRNRCMSFKVDKAKKLLLTLGYEIK